MELSTGDVDLREVVESVVSSLAESAQKKGLEIVCSIHPDVDAHLQGDAQRIGQILLNLVGNAIKFTHEGEIVVRVACPEKIEGGVLVRCEVTDTGIGIPQEAQARIFSPFLQQDGSTTRRYGGTGLGLSIARDLCRLMGGEIGVSSEPGIGSTFWFTARLKGHTAGAAAKGAVPATDMAGLRVLIVDDNETNRTIVGAQLSSWGIVHESAEDGPEALRLLHGRTRSNAPYDIAIIDMMMPGMDGLELAGRIKSDDGIAAISLIMLSSIDRPLPEAGLERLGIAACMTKPVRQSRLYNGLVEVAGRLKGKAGMYAHEETPAKHEAAGLNFHVLVAEDNVVNQKVAEAMLHALGCTVDVAENGKEAVDKYADGHYDLIFMDCQMPEMDGYEATRVIRVREREGSLPHTPVIALTAHAIEGDREACLAAGMDDYLAKPFKREQLISVMEEWAKPVIGDKPVTSVTIS